MLGTTIQAVYYGIVVDRNDPLRIGRVRVRISGVHTNNTVELPTKDLPWAVPIQSFTSAALSGIGSSATGVVEGTMVVCIFADEMKQIPLILGTIAGIPSETDEAVEEFDEIAEQLKIIPSKLPPENKVRLPSGVELTPEEVKVSILPEGTMIVEQPYIGSLTTSQVTKLKEVIAAKVLSLNNPPVEDDEMDQSLKENYTKLIKSGCLSDQSPSEKTAGALMAAYFGGIGPSKQNPGAIDYIKDGVDSIDSNGDSIASYYQEGYAVLTANSTVERPTPENMTTDAVDKNQSDINISTSRYDVIPSKKTQAKQGFKDPYNKYPLFNHLNEPDTPRLASGIKINETIVGEKDASRTKNISIANGSITWSQSPVPYNARYPYNHVYQSESGHVLEFDDTKDAERINLHHRAGTFMEIDSEGNQTNRVNGIRTIIVEEDELVNIKGSGHVSINGDMSIRIGGQCQIEVVGDANIHVKGNMNQQVDGNYNLYASGHIHFKSNDTLAGDATTIHLNSGVSSASAISSYSPTIKSPTPVNRFEATSISLEETEDGQKLLSQSASAAGSPIPVGDPDTSEISPILPVTGTCGFTELSYDTLLTPNFRLRDLCKDGGFPFDGQNGVSAEEIACNAKQLCINVIEPLSAKYGDKGIKINSCIRPRKNGKSQHEFGQAVDIGFSKIRGSDTDRGQYFKIAQEIKSLVPFDQLILEYSSEGHVWIHISFSPKQQRNSVFTMNNHAKLGDGLIQLGQA